MKYLICVLLLLSVGCTSYNDPSVKKLNQTTLSTKGDVVGTLPDGREIRRYKIDMGSSHDHWIYIVDNAATTTTNRTVPQGKTTANEVDVIIDGKVYTPAK